MFQNLSEFSSYLKIMKKKLTLNDQSLEKLNYSISDIRMDVLIDYYNLHSTYDEAKEILDTIKSDKIRYYKEEYNYHLEDSKDLMNLVYSDKEYLQQKRYVTTKETMLKGMEDLITTIKETGYSIKNAIEYKKYIKHEVI